MRRPSKRVDLAIPKGRGSGAGHVRLVDIARRLDIHTVTVSKALRDHPDIADATRDLIKRTAAEMGYSPNFFARGLRKSGSGIIGVVLPNVHHAFFAQVLTGIQSAAAKAGYEIVLGVSQDDDALERRHCETFVSMRADALLISVTTRAEGNLDIYRQAQKRGVPLIFFDRLPADDVQGLDVQGQGIITVDDRAASYAAVERALARGYDRIAHIAGPAMINTARARREGYEAALKDHGQAIDEALIVEGGFEEIDGYRGFQALWAGSEKPTAIFCASQPIAVGVLDAMRAIAPEAVGQIMILFFGTLDLLRFMPAPFICVVQPAVEMGQAAIAAALGAIALPGQAAVTHVVPFDLIEDTHPRPLPYLS